MMSIDARTFQKPLAELAETIGYKVQREAVKTVKPPSLAVDVYVMIRHVLKTYELFFYINSDEHRTKDPGWHVGFSAAALPLIRCMIDSLYNITMLFGPFRERVQVSCKRLPAKPGGYFERRKAIRRRSRLG